MKSIILLALVAFTSASPLAGWGGVGSYALRGGWGLWGYQTPQKEVAHQVAHQVTQGAIHDQLANTNEAIRNLQWQLQQYPHSWAGSQYGSDGGVRTPFHYDVGTTGPYGNAHQIAYQVAQQNSPFVAAEAIHHLQDDIQHQQRQLAGVGTLGYPQGSVTHQLHDTVEAGVEAHLVAGDVHHEQAAHGIYVPIVSGLHSGVFQTRLQKLIDEHNQQEIDNQIGHHHHWAQQLHQQQEFVYQQKQQIEAQQAIVQHQGVPEQIHQLELVHHELQLQEHHLIQEQLAHHLAILQLQQALVHKEQQVLQDTVAEHVHEQVAHGSSHPFWQQGSWSF